MSRAGLTPALVVADAAALADEAGVDALTLVAILLTSAVTLAPAVAVGDLVMARRQLLTWKALAES